MSEFKDKMCACKDKKCADDVQDQMNKWSAESAKNAGDKPEKPDEKTMKEMQDVGTKYGECMAKAMSGGGSADTGSAAAKPADPPPAAKSACVDGAYKDPTNTYCVKLPEGFTPPKESSKSDGKVRDQFESAGNNEFNITVSTTSKFDDMKANLSSENNEAKVTEKGDYEGTGFFVNHRNEAKKEGGAATLIKSGDKVIRGVAAKMTGSSARPIIASRARPGTLVSAARAMYERGMSRREVLTAVYGVDPPQEAVLIERDYVVGNKPIRVRWTAHPWDLMITLDRGGPDFMIGSLQS